MTSRLSPLRGLQAPGASAGWSLGAQRGEPGPERAPGLPRAASSPVLRLPPAKAPDLLAAPSPRCFHVPYGTYFIPLTLDPAQLRCSAKLGKCKWMSGICFGSPELFRCLMWHISTDGGTGSPTLPRGKCRQTCGLSYPTPLAQGSSVGPRRGTGGHLCSLLSLLSPWGPALARQGCCWLDRLNSGNRSSGALLYPSCTSHKAQSLIFTCVHEERG